jgi:hypothetical protein
MLLPDKRTLDSLIFRLPISVNRFSSLGDWSGHVPSLTLGLSTGRKTAQRESAMSGALLLVEPIAGGRLISSVDVG